MWKPITIGMKTWLRDDYGAHYFRIISSIGLPWRSVIRRITKDLYTGDVLEDLVVSPSEQQYQFAAVPDVPRNILGPFRIIS